MGRSSHQLESTSYSSLATCMEPFQFQGQRLVHLKSQEMECNGKLYIQFNILSNISFLRNMPTYQCEMIYEEAKDVSHLYCHVE